MQFPTTKSKAIKFNLIPCYNVYNKIKLDCISVAYFLILLRVIFWRNLNFVNGVGKKFFDLFF